MDTSSWIEFGYKETESALTVLYAYMGFYEALKDKDLVRAINGNKEFWRIHTASVQHTLFICLGRLSDDTRESKSFAGLVNHCMANVDDFSKDCFMVRRGSVLDINPEFLKNSEFPTKDKLRDLFALFKHHNSYLRAECKTIRSKVFAHAIYTEEFEYLHLFKSVELQKVEEALLAMWSVVQHLWQSFQNARTIDPKILEFSEKSSIFYATRKAIAGTI